MTRHPQVLTIPRPRGGNDRHPQLDSTEHPLPRLGAEVPPRLSYRDGWLRNRVALAPLWTALHVAAGFGSCAGLWLPAYAGWPPVISLGAAALIAAAALVTVDRTVAQATAVCVAVAVVIFLARHTPPAQSPDWRMWFVGATMPMGFAPLLDGRNAVAWSYVTALPAALLIGWAPHGLWVWVQHWDLALGPPLTLLFVALALRMHDRAQQRLTDSTEGILRAHRREQRDLLAGQAAEERRSALSTRVIPLLSRVWEGDVITATDRKAAALAEAEGRDQLLAGALVDDQIAQAARAARARGARVTLRALAVTPVQDEFDEGGTGHFHERATGAAAEVPGLRPLETADSGDAVALNRFRQLVNSALATASRAAT